MWQKPPSFTQSFDRFPCTENTCLSNAKLLLGKGLCLGHLYRFRAGGFSEHSRQASITVDMGRFSVSGSSRLKTRRVRPSGVHVSRELSRYRARRGVLA